jgi:hypothetical protein
MDQLINNWHKTQEAVRAAEQWNSLPSGKKYSSSTFSISIAHCALPTLTRMGQQSCGGQSYWKTDKDFGDALLRYLMLDWDKHFNGAISILKEDERAALLKCQAFVDKMQAAIDDANP